MPRSASSGSSKTVSWGHVSPQSCPDTPRSRGGGTPRQSASDACASSTSPPQHHDDPRANLSAIMEASVIAEDAATDWQGRVAALRRTIGATEKKMQAELKATHEKMEAELKASREAMAADERI